MSETESLKKDFYPCIIFDGKGDINKAINMAYKDATLLTEEQRIEVVLPEKDKKSISIDQARELRKKVTLKSKDSSYRVFIINTIAKMGSEAQNTLLKTLEELGENISIFMPVATINDVLPTIRSRSRTVTTTNILSNKSDRKQYLIDSATVGYRYDNTITEVDVMSAVEFIRYEISDRITYHRDTAEDKEKIKKLLLSLRVLCISTMREAKQDEAKIAWSRKLELVNKLIRSYDSNASGKTLLLGASTLL